MDEEVARVPRICEHMRSHAFTCVHRDLVEPPLEEESDKVLSRPVIGVPQGRDVDLGHEVVDREAPAVEAAFVHEALGDLRRNRNRVATAI